MRNGERGEEKEIVCEKGFGGWSVKVIDVGCIVFARKRSNEDSYQEQE